MAFDYRTLPERRTPYLCATCGHTTGVRNKTGKGKLVTCPNGSHTLVDLRGT